MFYPVIDADAFGVEGAGPLGILDLDKAIKILLGIVGKERRAFEHRQGAFAPLRQKFLKFGESLGLAAGFGQWHPIDALMPVTGSSTVS